MPTFAQQLDKTNATKLKKMIQLINPLLEKKIKIVGVTKEAMLREFSENGIELLAESDKMDDIPEEAVDFYNDFWESTTEDKNADEDVPPEKAPKKEAPKKEAPKTVKRTPVKKGKKKEVQRDEFGFIKGTKGSQFAASIKRKAKTMVQIKEEKWNEKQNTFYDTFNKLREKGIADKDEEGKMFIK